MVYIIVKYLITAAVVVLASEAAKRSDKLGALISSLPLVTILTLIWLHIENQSNEKIENHAYYTFWYVLPTLPMFLIFPILHQKTGFWPALTVCAGITILLFGLTSLMMKKFGIHL